MSAHAPRPPLPPTPAPAAPPGPRPVRRLLALAWQYRSTCLAAFFGQSLTLALGLGALGASGLCIDVVRRHLDPAAPAGAMAVRAGAAHGYEHAVDVGGHRRHRPGAGGRASGHRLRHRHPRWTPHPPRHRSCPAAAGVRQAVAPRPPILRPQRQWFHHQPRHRRRAVGAVVRRRRALARGGADSDPRRVCGLHGARARRIDGRLSRPDAGHPVRHGSVFPVGPSRLREEPGSGRRHGAGLHRRGEGHSRDEDVRHRGPRRGAIPRPQPGGP